MITLLLTIIIFFAILFALPEETVLKFHRWVRKQINSLVGKAK